MKIRHTWGFTIIELLIVIAIAAIISSMAVPAFSKLLEKRKIETPAEAIAADLQWARSEAIKRNTPVRVTFTTGTPWSYSINADPTGSNSVIKSVSSTQFPDTSMTSPLFSGNVAYTTFDNVRGTSGAGGVKLNTTNFKLKVEVSTLGRVHICTLDGSVNGYPDGVTGDDNDC